MLLFPGAGGLQKTLRRVAFVEVTYEKNAKHIFNKCGYSDIVNKRRTWESDEKRDVMRAASMVGEVRSRKPCCD